MESDGGTGEIGSRPGGLMQDPPCAAAANGGAAKETADGAGWLRWGGSQYLLPWGQQKWRSSCGYSCQEKVASSDGG